MLMKKIRPLAALCLLLGGCHTLSKDEHYNSLSPSAIYWEGVAHTQTSDYTQATEAFEALEARYPFGEIASKAQLGAIYASYLNADYPSALPAVDRFIRMYPRHPHVDYAYYMKGLIHFSEALGFFHRYLPIAREERDAAPAHKAFIAFTQLVTRYPKSEYVIDAKQRLVYLYNLLAQHELCIAQFYLRKEAFLPAALRAQYVIANFDRTTVLPEALSLLSYSYQKLGLCDLAEAARQVLLFNYPDNSEAF